MHHIPWPLPRHGFKRWESHISWLNSVHKWIVLDRWFVNQTVGYSYWSGTWLWLLHVAAGDWFWGGPQLVHEWFGFNSEQHYAAGGSCCDCGLQQIPRALKVIQGVTICINDLALTPETRNSNGLRGQNKHFWMACRPLCENMRQEKVLGTPKSNILPQGKCNFDPCIYEN